MNSARLYIGIIISDRLILFTLFLYLSKIEFVRVVIAYDKNYDHRSYRILNRKIA